MHSGTFGAECQNLAREKAHGELVRGEERGAPVLSNEPHMSLGGRQSAEIGRGCSCMGGCRDGMFKVPRRHWRVSGKGVLWG